MIYLILLLGGITTLYGLFCFWVGVIGLFQPTRGVYFTRVTRIILGHNINLQRIFAGLLVATFGLMVIIAALDPSIL